MRFWTDLPIFNLVQWLRTLEHFWKKNKQKLTARKRDKLSTSPPPLEVPPQMSHLVCCVSVSWPSPRLPELCLFALRHWLDSSFTELLALLPPPPPLGSQLSVWISTGLKVICTALRDSCTALLFSTRRKWSLCVNSISQSLDWLLLGREFNLKLTCVHSPPEPLWRLSTALCLLSSRRNAVLFCFFFLLLAQTNKLYRCIDVKQRDSVTWCMKLFKEQFGVGSKYEFYTWCVHPTCECAAGTVSLNTLIQVDVFGGAPGEDSRGVWKRSLLNKIQWSLTFECVCVVCFFYVDCTGDQKNVFTTVHPERSRQMLCSEIKLRWLS